MLTIPFDAELCIYEDSNFSIKFIGTYNIITELDTNFVSYQ